MQLAIFYPEEDKQVLLNDINVSELAFEINQIDFEKKLELRLDLEDSCIYLVRDTAVKFIVFIEYINKKEIQTNIPTVHIHHIKSFIIRAANCKNNAAVYQLIKDIKDELKREEIEKYEAWKKNNELTQKIEKKEKRKSVAITLGIVVVVLLVVHQFGSYLASGDYKFSEESSVIVPGRIVHQHTRSSVVGTYQYVSIEYFFEAVKYKTSIRIFDASAFLSSGDSLELQLNKNHPSTVRILPTK